MDFLSYLLTYGPQLLTNLIAWIGAALAFVAAITAWRAARNERSALVAANLESGGPGGSRVGVVNVGGRFALDVRLKCGTDTVMARHGGVAGEAEISLALPEVPASPVVLDLHWTDAGGRAGVSHAAFERVGETWRRTTA